MKLSNRLELITFADYYVGGLKRSVEIGVRKGFFSRYILSNTDVQQHFSVDPWSPNVELAGSQQECDRYYEEAVANLCVFGSRSIILRITGVEAAEQFENGSLDFVYIDALHDYDSVKLDIETWVTKVKPGGILAGHDYDKEAWPGVYSAVNEYVDAHPYVELHTTGLGDNFGETDGQRESWFVTRKGSI